MVLKTADRVLETSTTQGTGTLNLSGAFANFRSFVSGVGSGKKTCYLMSDNANWEVGIGTVTAGSPNTLSRTTILASSNSNAAVNWGPGTRNVYAVMSSRTIPNKDENLNYIDFAGFDTGTANAHVVTLDPAPLAYSDMMLIVYRVGTTNTTAAVQVNVNSLGAKNLKIAGADPVAGQLVAGTLIVGIYKAANNTIEIINLPAQNLTIPQNLAKSIDIASAATVDLATSTGNYVTVTGTTAITALGTLQAGTTRILRFTGALTLTYNATSLILPGSANILTTAGDTAEFISEGSGNWRCIDYQRANGAAIASAFSTYFESAEITYVAASTFYTTTHSLGAAPKSFEIILRCKTAEGSYAVGDEVVFKSIDNYSTFALTVGANATSVFAAQAGPIRLTAKSAAGTSFNATAANWRIVFRAWL